MPGLRKWLQKKLGRTKQSSQESPPPIPHLPAERPSILTPSPSREHLSPAIDNYGTFRRLPPEIRRQILIEAFGNLILHLDLKLSQGGLHPLVSNRTESRTYNAHRAKIAGNANSPQGWQWRGCVCHRRPWWMTGENQAHMPPHEDMCYLVLRRCNVEKSKLPTEYTIGAMGWIRTCRQSYVEGMDVLFRTNTFHMSTLVVLENLPRLVLPQCLQNITALELIFDISFPSELLGIVGPPGVDPVTYEDLPLYSLCRMIPETFPSIHHLYISLQRPIAPLTPIYGPRPPSRECEESTSRMERIVLKPIEDMVRVLGPGRDINIAIQRGATEMLTRTYVKLHGREKLRCEFNPSLNYRFWKPLGDELGYWICSGLEDITFSPHYHMQTCFGTSLSPF
ncbi:hypothetical protein F4677DRAFT_420712 [Hypoxylon crocopeplum]|nr:hypothetical protein F4677DRAFT_420712 [Hypoxylon crocopeplum]